MKKFFLTATFLFLLLVATFAYQYFKFNDNKLHLVFCNVGQGDGIFIRTPKGSDIVLDGGPDDSILSCLSRRMPFWDRTIELAFLTHPHEDHMRGFDYISRRYKVLSFNTEELSNRTATYQTILKDIQDLKIKTRNVFQGDTFKLSDGLQIKVVGPSKEFIEKTSPNGEIGESREFGSLELLFSFGSFSALTTGDSQIEELNEAQQFLPKVNVFQIPHHGSKYGADLPFLSSISPKLAIISVGKNKYGHPSPEILKILNDLGIKTLRTDKNGDIEIVADKTGQFKVR